MSKIEKEYKFLNINEKKVLNKLKKIATDKGIKNQKLYTYDLDTIKYRYLESKELIKSKNKLLKRTSINKLKQVLMEYEDLESNDNLNEIYKSMNIENFSNLMNLSDEEFTKVINNKILDKYIKKMKINPNKWIRLRSSNDKVELTIKHILNKSNLKYQKVLEYEIETSSFEETNTLLNALGIYKRNYQEKKRHSFVYKNAEIEIDNWPMLEPYLEIECESDEVIEELIDLLDLKQYEMVSLNTEELYKRKNINILEIDELKF